MRWATVVRRGAVPVVLAGVAAWIVVAGTGPTGASVPPSPPAWSNTHARITTADQRALVAVVPHLLETYDALRGAPAEVSARQADVSSPTQAAIVVSTMNAIWAPETRDATLARVLDERAFTADHGEIRSWDAVRLVPASWQRVSIHGRRASVVFTARNWQHGSGGWIDPTGTTGFEDRGLSQFHVRLARADPSSPWRLSDEIEVRQDTR